MTERARRRLLVAACAALFLTFLDTTVVAVALPDLQITSPLGVGDLQWVVDAYLVVFTALTLAGGALADRVGRRPLLLAGLAVFAVGSVLTAVSTPTGGWDGLRVGRVVQGLGAALSEPATLAVVRDAYGDPRQRARALGVWAAVAGLAVASGPVLGGLLVAAGGWRAVFWATVPLAVLAAALVAAWVPGGSVAASARGALARRARPDLPGLVLTATALAALTWGLVEAQARGTEDTGVRAALAVAVLAGVALVVVERAVSRSGREPALPLELVASARTVGANAAALAASFAVFAVFFFVSLDLVTIGEVTAGGAALAFLPLAGLLTLGGLVAGRWTGARGPTEPMVVGLVLAAAGLLACRAVLGVDPGIGRVAGALAVVGAGLGLVLAPAATAVLAAAPGERAGTAAAVVTLARQAGGLLAVGVLGVVAVGGLSDSLSATLERLRVPTFLRGAVRDSVLHPGRGGGGKPPRGGTSLLDRVVDGARQAFVDGARQALAVTAGLLVLAAVLCVAAALVTRGRRQAPAGRDQVALGAAQPAGTLPR